MSRIIEEALALPPDRQREVLLPLYRETYGHYDRGDWVANTRDFHPDYVFRAGGTARLPGMPEVAQGREGYIEVHRRFQDVVQVESARIDDVVPLGGNQVAVLSRIVLRLGDTIVEQPMVERHTFRDGLIVEQLYWFDRTEGMREMGLE